MKIETTEVSQKMVGIFCSADDKVPHEFKILAYELAKKLREKDLGIVTSASKTGLIREVARGYGSISITTRHFFIPDDNPTWTENLYSRLSAFHERCSVIVVLPGGFGTLHELMDFLVHNQLGLIKVPIIVLNIDGFWDGQLKQFEKMVEKNCLAIKHLSFIKVVPTLEGCIAAIDNEPEHQSHWELDEYWKKAAGA
ncbi:MAG: LOG family protein [Pseudomonadota bacterium]|nr:LOG family protein [Alphaproteobacteria bacterium]